MLDFNREMLIECGWWSEKDENERTEKLIHRYNA